MGSERGGDCGVDHVDVGTYGRFGVGDESDSELGIGEPWDAGVTDFGEIDSVLKAARRVYGMRNMEFEVQNIGTENRVEGEAERKMRRRDCCKHFATKIYSGGFEFGDMVWGKVKSHPWWPGQVFDEALAVSSARNTKMGGHVLVAFFGDYSYGWLHPADLVPFHLHYVEKSKQTNRTEFLNAVKHAEYEVGKRAALGLTCWCRNSSNFRPTNVEGVLSVDICGYENNSHYTIKEIKRARAEFRSDAMLYFLKKLALMPCANFQRNVHWIKDAATVLAYRRAAFERSDKVCYEAFQIHPSAMKSSSVLARQGKVPSRGAGTERFGFTNPAKIPNGADACNLPSASKPPKKRLKPDDYAKFVQDIGSHGVREMALSKLKNTKEQKSLPVGHKIDNKMNLKSPSKVVKKTDVMVPLKGKKSSSKKLEISGRVVKPTMLEMQFPHQSTLPSVSELKAKFARFGPFHASPQLFWKSFSCRVVFKYESDAQVARRYAVENRTLFGNFKVHYDVQVLELPGMLKSSKQSVEEDISKFPLLCSRNANQSSEPRLNASSLEQFSRDHKKSYPEKMQPSLVHSITGISTQKSHVKDTINGDGGNGEKQLGVNFVIQNPNGKQLNIVSSSSTFATLDDSGQNLKKVSHLPPWLPCSYPDVYQFVEACNQKHLQLEIRDNMCATNQNVDVSGALFNLLSRCSAIVADLKSSLGYVPYHL